jgi:ribulose-5-phosphate 4-epimerase/fuculose-1-phosphate aldolase
VTIDRAPVENLFLAAAFRRVLDSASLGRARAETRNDGGVRDPRARKEIHDMSGTDALVQARIDLAAALRWATRLGLSEGVCNHFSLAVPGLEDRFLINPQGLHWSEVSPADLALVDGRGNLVEGRYGVEPTAFFIHARLHRSKRAPACVLHTHMPFATSVTLLEGGRLEAASQNAVRFYGKVAYDEEYNGLVLDDAEGDRIASRLNGADVLFLANHGVIVCGDSVAWAFDDLYYLERACMVQVLAQSTGKHLKRLSHGVASATAKQLAGERQQSDLHFAALKRILDREDPGWSRLE